MRIIASVGERNELGRGGDLCWHLREDLRRFKQLTMGHPVIMGRKTWESLPHRPLPGRENIVITRGDAATIEKEGAKVLPTLEAALEYADRLSSEPYIIGGASVYEQAMALADTLELTRILATDPEADTFFPEISLKDWRLIEKTETLTSTSGTEYRFETYESCRRMP